MITSSNNMSTPYCIGGCYLTYKDTTNSSIFFMTGGLGTNPHLPSTTCILRNCRAHSNTLGVTFKLFQQIGANKQGQNMVLINYLLGCTVSFNLSPLSMPIDRCGGRAKVSGKLVQSSQCLKYTKLSTSASSCRV
jgi:hypothetical protein